MIKAMANFLMRLYTPLHSRIRVFLPNNQQTANGIFYTGKLGDQWDLAQPAGDNQYETGLIESLSECIEAGDHVCIVGGGHGITAIHAENLGAKLTVYEPSSKHANIISKRVDGEVIVDGFYGEANIYGEGTCTLTASDLPDCDVLELDCEGQELNLLNDLQSRPQSIIVESHGFLGCSKDDVLSSLKDLGYDVEIVACQDEEKGIYVMKANYGR